MPVSQRRPVHKTLGNAEISCGAYTCFNHRHLNMSFITKNNARQLEYQVDRDEIEKIMLDDLYKLSLWMLTKKEQQWLAAARIFYENPEFYVNHIYKKSERKADSNLVYPPGPPAYHARQDCEVLRRDYVNYEIPLEIIGRGEDAVREFREWWKSQEQLLNSNSKRFLELMSIRWLLLNPPSLQSITADNSGVETLENPEFAEVELEIDDLIKAMNEIRRSHPVLIKEYGKRTFAVRNGSIQIDDASDRRVLEDWDSKKDLLKRKLRLFFQLRFNPELEISGSVLDSLGFKKCKRCHEREQAFSF